MWSYIRLTELTDMAELVSFVTKRLQVVGGNPRILYLAWLLLFVRGSLY